jgi:hypothetical protein
MQNATRGNVPLALVKIVAANLRALLPVSVKAGELGRLHKAPFSKSRLSIYKGSVILPALTLRDLFMIF